MSTYNFSANAVDFGDYEADSLAEAKELFASDAGYKSWAHLDAGVIELDGRNEIEIIELADTLKIPDLKYVPGPALTYSGYEDAQQ